MKHAFHRALKKFLVSAFSTEKLSPENVSAMLSRAIHRPCGAIYRKEIEKILTERGIQDLVHFTPIQNVCAICKYGLIPRDYLNCEVLKLALGPHFPDALRLDGATEFSCLSITSPNYKMLYSKRQAELNVRWAVIVYSAKVLEKLWAEYCPTNAASKAPVMFGGDGMRTQFMLSSLRKQLNLSPSEPTDPQAEVLCDSVVLPSDIRRICVELASDRDYLSKIGVNCVVEPSMFRSRHDWAFWQRKRITDFPEFIDELKAIETFRHG